MFKWFKSIVLNNLSFSKIFLFLLISFLFFSINISFSLDATNIEPCSAQSNKEEILKMLDYTFNKILETKAFEQISLKKKFKENKNLGKIHYYKFFIDKILLIQVNYLEEKGMLYGRHYLYCSRDELEMGICDKHEELFEYNLNNATCTEVFKNAGNKLILFMKDLIQNPPTITTLMNKKRFYYPIIMEFKTDRPTSCRFDTSDKEFDNMKFATNSGDNLISIHKYCYESAKAGHNSIYVKCVDEKGNSNLISKVIGFDILKSIGFDEENLKADFYFMKINNKNVKLNYKQFIETLKDNYNKNIYLALIEVGDNTEMHLFFDKNNVYYKNIMKDGNPSMDKSKCNLQKEIILVKEGRDEAKVNLSGAKLVQIENGKSNNSQIKVIYNDYINKPSISIINYIAPEMLKDGNTALSDLLKLMIQIFIMIMYLVVLIFILKQFVWHSKIIFIKIPLIIYKNIQKSFNNKIIQNRTVSNILKYIRLCITFILLFLILNFLSMKFLHIKFYEQFNLYLGIIFAVPIVSVSAFIYPILKSKLQGFSIFINIAISLFGIMGSSILLILLSQNINNLEINFINLGLFNINILITSFAIIFLMILSYSKLSKKINDIEKTSNLISNKEIAIKLSLLSIILFPILFLLCQSILFIDGIDFFGNYKKFLIEFVVNYQYILLLILSSIVLNLSILLMSVGIKGSKIEKSMIVGTFNTSLINLYLFINVVLLSNIYSFSLFITQVLFYFLRTFMIVYLIHTEHKFIFNISISKKLSKKSKKKKFDIKNNESTDETNDKKIPKKAKKIRHFKKNKK